MGERQSIGTGMPSSQASTYRLFSFSTDILSTSVRWITPLHLKNYSLILKLAELLNELLLCAISFQEGQKVRLSTKLDATLKV